jgi:diaminohydroxyphosphoribosylaminopyrimidine deaminase/5-amino-6-(5-phosphoribosylamino)uracil reductase
MHRCLQLARLGAGYVAPNPMVGAVLVYEDQIIGEGWHEHFGEAHAEVNCIRNAIAGGFEKQLPGSTLYVSLEPCAHHGKTPPCTDLIAGVQIPRVVIGCQDPFVEVNGRGIEKLRQSGIETITGVLEQECRELNKRFFRFHTEHRPYVILKWAQTADGIMGRRDSRLMISHDLTSRLVHRWRSEEASILVGTNTALVDDPELTNRLWPGPSPLRLVIDIDLKLPPSLKLFNGKGGPVIVFNARKHGFTAGASTRYYRIDPARPVIDQVLQALFSLGIQSVLVEGGAKLLQSFMDARAWDESRVIISPPVQLQEAGVHAPLLPDALLTSEIAVATDTIRNFKSMQAPV